MDMNENRGNVEDNEVKITDVADDEKDDVEDTLPPILTEGKDFKLTIPERVYLGMT